MGEQPQHSRRYREGLAVRRSVLGDAHVDRAEKASTDFDRPFQELITETAWGNLWARPGWTKRERSMVTLALLAALGHDDEVAMHVRATATGKVMGLSATTVGGVIAPGQKLMDIVPVAAPLVIDAMIEAKDGNDIKAGQVAQVRFTSLHERDVPILKGKVLDVSGDAFTDKASNRSFYTARVQISPETAATLNRIVHDAQALKPGLPVEVVVPLRKRTVLQYLLEPLNQSLWKTFRES